MCKTPDKVEEAIQEGCDSKGVEMKAITFTLGNGKTGIFIGKFVMYPELAWKLSKIT